LSLFSDTSRSTPPLGRPPFAELALNVIQPTQHIPEPTDSDLFTFSSTEND
jgi:hypothetical protein